MGSEQRAWVICKNNILNKGDGNIKTNNLLECFYLKESVRPFSIIACSVILIAVKLGLGFTGLLAIILYNFYTK